MSDPASVPTDLWGIFAKGGIGAVAVALFLRWLAQKGEQTATWLTTQFEAFHTRASEAAKTAQLRCEAENAKLVERIQSLEDQTRSDAKEREIALREMLGMAATAIKKQADNETDRHKALSEKEAHG